MNRKREKMNPGARLFGSALASLKSPSLCQKPKSLGSKGIKNPDSTSLESSSTSSVKLQGVSIPVSSKHSSTLMEETDHSLRIQNTYRVNETSFHPAISNKDELNIPVEQPRPTSGFHELDTYSPKSYPVPPSTPSYDLSSVPTAMANDDEFTTPIEPPRPPPGFHGLNSYSPQSYPVLSSELSSVPTTMVNDDEFTTPIEPPRPPPGFHGLSTYTPRSYPVHHPTTSYGVSSVPSPYSTDSYTSSYSSEVPTNYSSSTDLLTTRYSTDPYSPYYSPDVPTYRSREPSFGADHFLTPVNYANYSSHQTHYFTPLSSPPSYQENTDFNSAYSLSSTLPHEKERQSLYSLSATDLARQIPGEPVNSNPDSPLSLNFQDSGCPLSDDNDSSGASAVEQEPFTCMSYYHMANNSELYSTEEQVLNEVPQAEKKPEPKQAPVTLISGRVNRRNVNRIQGANTCISSGGRSNTAFLVNRRNLPQSVAKYSSSDDSGADISTDEDRSSSPSVTECRGCEALSERVSSADAQRQWKALPEYGRTAFLSLKCKPGFIDSHCHLDFLLGRLNHDGTYAEYMQMNRGTYPVSYEGCVAVFCNPNTFHKRGMWQKYLGEEGVWGAFGCHPHHSKYYDSTAEHHLVQAIQHSKVRALGEIGLDYSNRNDCSTETQHSVFRRQLKIAIAENLPLVIHCRDANEDIMRIMKEIVPRDYTIHLHCFTDGWDWAQKYLNAFPNLCIGITNLVTFPSAEPTHEVVKMIPLDRLLLETDAPYFVPRKIARTTNFKHSHPGMAIHVAAQIAALRGVSLKEIIHHTRENTKKVYGI